LAPVPAACEHPETVTNLGSLGFDGELLL
jgi:hypothetical protein